MWILQIINDLWFYSGYIMYRIYEAIWTPYLLPLLDDIRGRFRIPVNASLPQYDSDSSARFILQRRRSSYYNSFLNSYLTVPVFQLFTFFFYEFFINIILASPLLFYSIANHFDDGRYIRSEDDLRAIVKKFGLIDNMIRSTDDNCYQLNPSFEIMRKMTPDKKIALQKSLKSAIYFTADIEKVMNQLNNDLYFFQDCDAINLPTDFQVDGLYVPYMDGEKKRLRIETIVLTDKRFNTTYVFQMSDSQWTVIRNKYINWTRFMGSALLHQLGPNVYCPSFFYHSKKTLSAKHPISALTQPFMEGIYFTNNIFTSMGISIPNTETYILNQYMEKVELFDLSNKPLRETLKYAHSQDGKYVMNYPAMIERNGLSEIYFEQKELLMQFYELINELVTNVIDYYYRSETDYKTDPELYALSIAIQSDFPFIGDLRDRNILILFLTNIIYLSTIRHTQSHINYVYLNSFYDYSYRRTWFNEVLQRLYEGNTDMPISMLYSTVGDFYKKYSSDMYPGVPINRFNEKYANYFTDSTVNGFFQQMVAKFNKIKSGLIRDQFTEFIFRAEKSNTI